jgi:sialic acid synthase SpsE
MRFKPQFQIAGRPVGRGCLTYLIAEIGRNHNGDPGLAKEMIDAAVGAGADAVKFQSFKADNLVRKDLTGVVHVDETGKGKSLYELTLEAELKPEWHADLKAYAESKGVHFFSTPEDLEMVALLGGLDIPVYKIASLDIRYRDLIGAIADQKKPVIISTGMSYLSEVEAALDVLTAHGVSEVVVLQCTSNYPPRDEDVNLRAMETLARAFDVPVGFSDHTMGIGASIASVALGACVIERHFTMDRGMPGTDHRISLNPAEFALMAKEIRSVEKAMGSTVKAPCENEMAMRRVVRRRLVAARPLTAGQVLEKADIAVKCSEEGYEAEMVESLIGRRARMDLAVDRPLTGATVE